MGVIAQSLAGNNADPASQHNRRQESHLARMPTTEGLASAEASAQWTSVPKDKGTFVRAALR